MLFSVIFYSCFISEMIPFLVAFLLPTFLVLIMNVVIYVLVIRVIILHAVHKNKRMNKSSLTIPEVVKMLFSWSGIMVLFGLTWLFAIFTFITESNASFVIQFFFAFFNTFQGFFTFLFLVILNKDSRDAWRLLLCPWVGKKQSTSATAKHKSVEKFTSSTQVSSPTEKKTVHSMYESLSDDTKLVKAFNSDLTFKNETVLEDVDDEYMKSEFDSIRFERHLSVRRKHYVEKIEIDFFDNDNDADDDDQ